MTKRIKQVPGERYDAQERAFIQARKSQYHAAIRQRKERRANAGPARVDKHRYASPSPTSEQ